jgi:pyruvate/2-oxoglutarate dehydrogenase complex dihydrolipoamide acyltransferase (E2) component
MNAALDGSMIKIFKEIHIGVAVALEQGLVVPVVKHANKKSLLQNQPRDQRVCPKSS